MRTSFLGELKKITDPVGIDYFSGVRRAGRLPLPDNILSFCPSQAGGSRRAFSRHGRFVFLHNTVGRGVVVLDEHMFEFDQGHTMLFFPFQAHYYLDVKDSSGWMFITFDLRDYQHLESLRNRVILRTPRMDLLLEEFLLEYNNDTGDVRRGNRLAFFTAMLLEDSLSALRSEETAALRPAIRGSRFAVLEEVQRAVFQSIDSPVSIKQLADRVHQSESHLRLLFRREFGIGLGHYIRETKMMHASRLLATTSMRVREVAEQCGYDTVFAFSRAFKTSRGISPLKYRKSFPRYSPGSSIP